MQKLNLPEYSFRYRINNEKQHVFDFIRKKYVMLTPEEWVRQNFLAWLVNNKHYPAGLIAVEKELKLNELKKRCDIVVYNNCHSPVLLIECKAPGVEITQKVFDQAARYNIVLKVNHLIVTNGMEHYCCFIDFEKETHFFMDEIPDYEKF